MSTIYKTSIFIFRRDLRLIDNTGLNAALSSSEKVIPVFIFDPRQIGDKNQFKSLPAIQFMIHSLKELNAQLVKQGASLGIFYGEPDDVITQLIHETSCDAVFANKDYTPFSIERDKKIKEACISQNKKLLLSRDALLNEPDSIFNQSNVPYTIFTPFFKKSLTLPVSGCAEQANGNWYTDQLTHNKGIDFCNTILAHEKKTLLLHGGRKEALKMLESLDSFQNYAQTHDYPQLSTTHLSAHLKFGTVSAREAYHSIAKELGAQHPLIRQLYWRDFFYHIAYHSPFVFGHAFKQKYDSLTWKNDETEFQKWCNGMTGFPIVDAGMRELNTTGFMHNRVRMIVGSFLTKDLHIDWQWGERYFAQQLIDYDPAVNNGNWQWVASTGADAQPYFRIFNPWLQQKKFDVDCLYIKKWVPELQHLTPNQIHGLEKKIVPELKYPRPMVDHGAESILAKLMYKNV